MITSLLAIIVLMVLTCSGSAYMCSLGDNAFEDYLPITFIAIVFINFIFGLLGLLLIGFYISLAAALLMYLFVGINIKRNIAPGFGKRFFSQGFFAYVVLSAVLMFLNYGKLMASWDEFSHWGDVVKMMTTLNVLSTNPTSGSLFPEYPPAMALFQYFSEKIYALVSGREFSEWLLYYSYQLFMFSLYFPFVKKLDFKKIGAYMFIAIVFLLPTVFQNTVYSKIYIDSFLSSVFGIALAYTVQDVKQDRFYYIYVFSLLALLPITKMIGILFAIIVIAVFALFNSGKKTIYAVICAGVPAVLWHVNVRLNSANAAFDLNKISNAKPGYASEVLSRYLGRLISFTYSSSEAVCPQLAFVILFPILTLCLYFVLSKKTKGKIVFWILLIFDLIFVVGLGWAYVHVFSEAEAQTMTELSRYINNALMAQALLIVLNTIEMPTKFMLAAFVITILFTPLQSTARFVTRREVLYSQSFREPYKITIDEILEQSPRDGKVIIVTESTDAMDYMVFKTTLRPMTVVMCYMPGDENKLEDCLHTGYDYLTYFEVTESFTLA